MEAFNLLKFWRNTTCENLPGNDVISDIDYVNSDYQKTPIKTTTITTDVRNRAPDIELETDDDSDSFFELEFSALDSGHKELKTCSKFPESPTDFFSTKSNCSKAQSPIQMLRSGTKFKVLMFQFRKSKTEASSDSTARIETRRSFESGTNNPVISRDNSLRTKMMREILDESNVSFVTKKSEKDVKKYLKLIKPLYSVASRRYSSGERNKFSAVSPMFSPATATVAGCSPRRSSDEKFGYNRASGLKVVYKHLGKSRSASSAGVGGIPSPVKRRDDSLLLHNDGIQSAILHCKRSYNSADKELSRCLSDSSEAKRCSI